jgi:type VI secretion system protein VasG
VEALRPHLLNVFKPAFLGRLIVVPHYLIADEVMRQIFELQLGGSALGCKRTIGRNSHTMMPWGRRLVSAAPRLRAEPVM